MERSVLIVEHAEVALKSLQHAMEREGYRVTATRSGIRALGLLEAQRFGAVVVDLHLEKVGGLEVLKTCRALQPDTEVIVMASHATAEDAVQAMKLGAFDFLPKPLRPDEVRKVLGEALEKVRLHRQNAELRRELESLCDSFRIVTQDPAMERLLDLARRVAPTDCNILISGESGTGKELFARYVHRHSARSEGPYMAVNCGAFNEQLLANELFGHERGAFTGATALKHGLVEASSGGTLFLDEVTEMAMSMQVKMLRVLQEKEVLRLGGTKPVKCDVRVVAATNRIVADVVKKGSFREDLSFRLNVVNLHIPPLRDRKGDVPLLARHFLLKAAARMKRDVVRLSEEALAVLNAYPFPGNVRELENIIERGTAVTQGDTIELEHLPEHVQERRVLSLRKTGGRLPTLEEQERAYIRQVLDEVHGNQTAAAQILGINRASLWRKLKAQQAALDVS